MCNKFSSLLFIVFSFTFSACKQNTPLKKLVTTDFKYSAYYWHFNEQVDSFEFYLVHYIRIDEKGNFLLMRHDKCMGKPKYFSGLVNDTIRQYLDTTFYYDNFKTDYSWNINNPFIYDGFTYCVDYKKQDSEMKQIQFIPNNSPTSIKKLSLLLDTLISNASNVSRDTLDLKSYTKQLKQLYITVSGHPPKPSKVLIEFKPSRSSP